ncbi:MAG: T9SS type A sorting domain-containing protein [bacterium]|nr:T9SS type A sorting domain-containing protein [bacterium]
MKKIAVINVSRIPHPTNAMLSSTHRFFASLPLTRNFLLTLLILFLFCSLARAEWVPLDSMAANYTSGQAHSNGLGYYAEFELHRMPYQPDNGSYISLYELQTGRKLWSRPLSTINVGEKTQSFVNRNGDVVIVLQREGVLRSFVFNRNGDTLRDWQTIVNTNIGIVDGDLDDSCNLYLSGTFGYYTKINPDGTLNRLVHLPFETYGTPIYICHDGDGGAYIWSTYSPIQYVTHVFSDSSHIVGPVEVRRVIYLPNVGYGTDGFCYSSRSRLLYQFDGYDYDTSYTIGYRIHPDSLTLLQVDTVFREPGAYSLPVFCDTPDTIWQFRPRWGLDSSGQHYITQQFEMVACTRENGWVVTDTFPRSTFLPVDQGTGILRIDARGNDLSIGYANRMLTRRVRNQVAHEQSSLLPTNPFTIYPNPTNGRFSLFMGGRQTNRILVYNLLGQTIASYQPHTGILVQSILLPGSLPSGTYYLQVQTSTHPTQVLPLHYIK